ncbi:MAG TPA: antibiotic biosynthesis monooxygenase family protein [Pseudonocardiaceae bacterium]|nr:antibiotic biosynthesis monooxygenase family protein [Pseudonocardiaceae bacterium]
MSLPTPGFRVMLTMHIKPGMGADFEHTWQEVSAAVSGHPANLGHWLLRSSTDDDLYYVCSDWVDEPRFREFEGSPTHVEHRQKLHPYRSSGTMATMRVVGHVPGRAVGIR